MFCLRPIPVQLWRRNIQKLSCEIICMVFQSQKEDMPKTTPCVRVIEIPDRKWQSRGEWHLNTWGTRGKHMTTMFCMSYPGRGGCVWVESSQGNCSPPRGGVVVKANSCFTSIEKILYWVMKKVIMAVAQERSKASSSLNATYSVPRAIIGSCQFLKEISLKF